MDGYSFVECELEAEQLSAQSLLLPGRDLYWNETAQLPGLLPAASEPVVGRNNGKVSGCINFLLQTLLFFRSLLRLTTSLNTICERFAQMRISNTEIGVCTYYLLMKSGKQLCKLDATSTPHL